MNSDEERKLFEAGGWEYNHVAREWVSSGKKMRLTLDAVVELSQTPEGEARLRWIVQQGVPKGPR